MSGLLSGQRLPKEEDGGCEPREQPEDDDEEAHDAQVRATRRGPRRATASSSSYGVRGTHADLLLLWRTLATEEASFLLLSHALPWSSTTLELHYFREALP